MIESSAAYCQAAVADRRRTYVRAVVDISGPDKVFLPVEASPEAPWSRPEQLHDRNFNPPPRYATAEPGRAVPDGSFSPFPDGLQSPEPVGYAGEALSGADGVFPSPQFAALRFENIHILQTVTLFFSSDPTDGVPEDFLLEVRYNGTAYYRAEVTGNLETARVFDGFTVWDPDEIRLTVYKWSLPGRRFRLVEIFPGLYEEWSGRQLASFSVQQQGQFSCLSLPYGTASIAMDNQSRRFEPRRKDGIFQSLEARQDVDLYMGFQLPGGAVEYKRLGLFYQADDGWKTGDNSLTMKWSLVDIVGLLVDRTFLPPETLPTTLAGWFEAVTLQLGRVFSTRWYVDPDYADMPVTANSVEDVTGKKCGDIIRWACQVSGTWPRADAETGKLTAEPLWKQGNQITLGNLEKYPVMKANESISTLIFQLALPPLPEGAEDNRVKELVIPGNQTASEKTVTVQNPFIHTAEQARTAAKLILSQYGGNQIETTGRGDPASEIGDVDTIWLDASNATTARRISQTLQIQNGVLQGCQSTLLQADGAFLYEERVVVKKSGSWQAPPGVEQIFVVIGQGGQGGSQGQDGYVRLPKATEPVVESGYGENGADGHGGKIWFGTIHINPEQTFEVQIGRGGAKSHVYGTPGKEGGETSFGPYSSASGDYYPTGFTDINAGDCFGRTGVPAPVGGTGDGGKGGAGGTPGDGEAVHVRDTIWGKPIYELEVYVEPGPGLPGADGANGFVVITWDKPEEK
ncbi:MAG: hypothetical protein HFG05_03880 [Oscillibacter sp.]|nr:hypothetical protein [Oscillibacter sp.]